MAGSTVDYLSSQIYSRLIPSFFSDVAKAVDPNVRKSVKGVESIKAKNPGLSTTLSIKTNIFGEEIKNEPGLSTILFGSRIKSSREDDLIRELNTVSTNNDKGIAFTDWDKSASKTLVQFKDVVGEKTYNEAKIEYGKELKSQLEMAINDPVYQDLSNEEKLQVINNQDAEAMATVLNNHGFVYKKETSRKIPKL
jgi:hypothetical protein